nr:hypothetical protein BCU55_04490 [Shewanella sp. 10N.286.48.A6]
MLNVLMGMNINRDHLTYREYKQADTFLFSRYYKFCFVRNPFDRIVSVYEYLKKGGNQTTDMYFKELLSDKFPDFESFVFNYLNSESIQEHVLMKPQYLFIYNERNECMVDFVGKFENINEDYKVVAKRLKLKMSLPKHNNINRNSYESYYNREDVISKIAELYNNDFFYFNYPKSIY